MNDSTIATTKSKRRLTVSGKIPVQRPASLTSSRIEDLTEPVRLPGAAYRIVLNCKGTGSNRVPTKKSQSTK